MQILLIKKGLGETYIPLNFESDLDHHLDKKYPDFPIITCLGGGRHSPSCLCGSYASLYCLWNNTR